MIHVAGWKKNTLGSVPPGGGVARRVLNNLLRAAKSHEAGGPPTAHCTGPMPHHSTTASRSENLSKGDKCVLDHPSTQPA